MVQITLQPLPEAHEAGQATPLTDSEGSQQTESQPGRQHPGDFELGQYRSGSASNNTSLKGVMIIENQPTEKENPNIRYVNESPDQDYQR